MAKRQFTSSDTNAWGDKYSNGSSGAKVYSADHQMDSSDGAYYSRVSGTLGNTTGNTPDIADGTYNLPCKIINEYSNASPNWEYNFLISVASGVATFKYPLTITCNYSGLGSQIITGNPYASVVVNSGKTITAPAWNGSYGGRIVWFARDSWTNHGTIQLSGYGFRGGSGVNADSQGYSGEGTEGVSVLGRLTPSGNEGGGGGYSNNGPWDQGNGGGGASNYTAGENGTGSGGGNNSNGGAGLAGVPTTTADGVTDNLGGGGGSGGNKGASGASGNGGIGGGCLDVISRQIISDGAIYLNGNNGSQANYHAGAGGSGAAGHGTFKGQRINITGTNQAAGGAHIYRDGNPSTVDEAGGYAGNGYFTTYYGQSQTITSTPSTTPIIDPILNDSGGDFISTL